eukprot:66094_1
MGYIVVYSITGCKYCKAAKSLLKQLNVEFSEINLDHHPERRKEMVMLANRKTVPQIFFNLEHIGGFDDLNKLNESGELNDRIHEALAALTPRDMIAKPVKKEESHEEATASEKKAQTDAENNWDYLSDLVKEMRESATPLCIKDRIYRFWLYRKCFVGSEAIEWLMKHKNMPSDEAKKLMFEMFAEDMIHHVAKSQPFRDGTYFYRFQADEDHTALNTTNISKKPRRSATELGHEIRQLILEMYNDFLSEDGNAVDYEGLANSKYFESYCRVIEELQNTDVFNIEHDEKLAFWVNIYNALVIHGRVINGPPNGFFQRMTFFRYTKYHIGGYDYSLDDMENGVLRGNRVGPGKLQRQFSGDDPRKETICKNVDPRIHFALVCGAKSCPPIKLFAAKSINEDLTLAAEAFLEDEVTLDVKSGDVTLSMIFKWFRQDFGKSDEDILRFVRKFSSTEKQVMFDSLLESNFALKYSTYDWGSNSK